MKKTGLLSIFLLLTVMSLQGGIVKIGAFAGYFATADKQFKETYSEGDVIYGVKLGFRVYKGLSLWVSGGQFKGTGETSLLGDITNITVNPIDLSVRYTFRLGAFNPYLEGGFTYIYFNETSDIGDTKSEGKGYFLSIGGEIKLSSHFSIDIGAKISRAKVNPKGEDVELGGTQAGLSLLIAL